jgi:DNA polymerase-1
MARVWEEIVCPAVEALIRVERVGAGCDIAAVDACGLYFQTRMREVSARLHAAGLTNPSSPDAVGRFLFATLGLAPPMKTKKGADSTAKKALVALSGKHPAVGDLLLWRKLSTLNNTYAVGLRKQIASDGRIHTSYVLDGTETGRMSSRQPNLQNIPRSDTPEGKMVKNCFVARPGHTLVQFDYSQLELRIAAMLSQDPDMLAIFNTPDPVTGLFADYHMATARIITPIIWHDDWDRLSPDEQKKRRTLAKPVNFGLLYGRGDRALAEEMHSTVAMAAKVRAAVLGHFRVLAKWIEGQVTLARKTGEIWTWWGGGPARRRPLLDVASPDDEARGTAERSSYNTPCQGTGSDFCLSSLVAVDRWLAEDGLPADVVLTVHDSLVLDVRDDAVAEVVPEVIAIMEGWNSGGVRLRVDCEVGRAWGSLKPYVAGTV